MLWVGAKSLDRVLLEGVEVVVLAALEGQVGDEAVADGAVLGADPLSELDRERRRDRDAARHVEIIVRRGHRLMRLQHASDDIACIEAAHLVDDPADLAGLPLEQALRQFPEVEPYGERQPEQPEDHGSDEKRSHRPLLTHDSLAYTCHGGSTLCPDSPRTLEDSSDPSDEAVSSLGRRPTRRGDNGSAW
jgi:hypothetical protein